MRRWSLLLGGLLVWAAHFFTLYAIASIFPGTQTARILAIAVTGLALAASIAIISSALAARRRDEDALDAWIADVGLVGGALSFVSVLWQGAPAVM